MKQRLLTALFLPAILALTALGCSGATPAVDAPQEASAKPYTADANPSEIEAVTAEQLADCLATMFPQMNRDELERQVQMQMTDTSSVENAEAFVERVCGDGQTPAQAASTGGVAIASPDTPESAISMALEPVRGLGVTRAEMEEFFLAMIERDGAVGRKEFYPDAFTSVGDAAGAGKVTEVEWGGWENAYEKRGKYAALAGMDEDLHGIGFAYEPTGRSITGIHDIRALMNQVAPADPESRLKRVEWIERYLAGHSCGSVVRVRGGGGGGGGGLSNVLPRRDRDYGPTRTPPRTPRPTRTPRPPFLLVQNGVKMHLICKAGKNVVYVLADNRGATPN